MSPCLNCNPFSLFSHGFFRGKSPSRAHHDLRAKILTKSLAPRKIVKEMPEFLMPYEWTDSNTQQTYPKPFGSSTRQCSFSKIFPRAERSTL